MGNFNKSYIIREAENILYKLNMENGRKKDKDKIKELNKKNKKLKRMNFIWKICTSVFIVLFVAVII